MNISVSASIRHWIWMIRIMLHFVEHIILLTNRFCKDEVITDFQKEVKKIKEVKLYSSRQPGLLQQMETFLVVKLPPLLFDLKWARTPT